MNPCQIVSGTGNRGYHEYLYQTRSDTDSPYITTGSAAYDAETDDTLKRRIKVRITDDVDGESASEFWINARGERITGSFATETSSGTISAGSNALTLSPAISTTEAVGKLIVIAGAGFAGRLMRTRIATAPTGTSITLTDKASTAVTAGDVWIGGAFCKVFQIEDLADWSSLPLPNNHA